VVVKLMHESAGRNKGREEGDVRTIRRGWMLQMVFAEPAVVAETIVFFREQRASGRLCFSMSREPLDGCDLL
jgi:hypothetical protein